LRSHPGAREDARAGSLEVPMKRSLPALVLAVALVVGACGGGSSSTTPSGGPIKNGGVLRIAAYDGIDSMNPFVGVNDDSYAAYEYIYPQLVQYDASLNIVADFATKWSESTDGKTWTFQTVPNAKWSDGQPLTAEDAAWTYNTTIKFKKGATAGAAGAVAHMIKATTKGPNELILHYDRPVPAALAQLQQISILPEHVWSKFATGNGQALKTYPNSPTKGHPLVTGGPFTVTQYQQNGTTLFQANRNYYGPKPHIQGFGLTYFSNEDAEVIAMKSGNIDVVENVPASSVSTLQAQPDIKVNIGPSLTFRTFIINSSPYRTEHPELMNPQVRMAFEYAIDRNSLVKTAWLGYAQPGSTIVPPASGKWHDPSIQPLPFDINKANQILDSLGYKKGPGGIRIANGHPMQYDVIFPASERGAGDRDFQIIQSDFQQIGVKLIQKPVTGAYSYLTAPDNKYANWDLAMWNWTPPIDPDFILFCMTTKAWGNWSDSGYTNPAYDKLYIKQGEATNPADRLQIVYKMQQIVYNDRPYIVLVYNDSIFAYNTAHWAGLIPSPQGPFSALSKDSLDQVHMV
jgi:peptide/nickel transport system substrate-binding protein